MNSSCGIGAVPFLSVVRDKKFSKVLLFLSTVNIAAAVVTVTGNLLVMIAIWRTPSLHRPSVVLLAGLALSDLAVGLISEPIFVAQNTVDSYNCDLFLGVLRAHLYFANQLLYATFLTLCATAVERFLALKLHLRYQELVTVRRTLLCLCFIWITATIIAAWVLIHPSSAITGGIILGLGGTTTTVICYLKIFRIVRYHQTQIQSQVQTPQQEAQGTIPNIAQYRKSVRTLLYIGGFFCLTYVPWLFFGFAKKFVNNYAMAVEMVFASRVIFTISILNSCFNPFLYCWRMGEIRQAMKEQLKLLWRCISGN